MIEEVLDVFRVMVEKRIGEKVTPYPYQEETFKAFERLVEGEREAIIVQAPCSGGKTEAIIAPYLAQYVTNEIMVPRLIYATPTQTLLYNMVDRFRGYVVSLAEEYESFRKHYEHKLLPDAEHGFDVHPSYLVPRFTVSTYDVIAYAWMSRRTLPLRPFTTRGALLTSLLVFDEAHLLQDLFTYSQRVFQELVTAMIESGIPVVIMSATLPKQVIDFIVERIGKERVEIVKADGFAPKVGNIFVEAVEIDAPYLEVGRLLNEIRERVLKAVDSKEDVLIVLNTVRLAQIVFEELRKVLKDKYGDKLAEVNDSQNVYDLLSKGKQILLSLVHGRLSLGTRRRRENVFEVLKKLKKREVKQWIFIAVATQVAEVGVDYSFDLVITEIAPPTAIIQRIMRGGRDEGQRSKGVVLPVTRFPSTSEEAVYLPYSKELIEYSSRWLKENKLDMTLLADVNFLAKTAEEEYDLVSQNVRNWVEELVSRAKNVIEASKYIPPLATEVHKKVLEGFRLRLGEYVAIHIVKQGELVNDLNNLRNIIEKYLHDIGAERLVDESIKVSLRFHGRGEERYVEVPSIIVWSLNEDFVIPYVTSLRAPMVDFVKLRKEKDKLCVSEGYDITSIFNRIALAKPTPNYSEDLGLIEVDAYEVHMSSYR